MKYDFPKEIQFMGKTLRLEFPPVNGVEAHYRTQTREPGLFVRHWITPRWSFGEFSGEITVNDCIYIKGTADTLAGLEKSLRASIIQRITKLDEELHGFHAFL